jgi:hypothetical protein
MSALMASGVCRLFPGVECIGPSFLGGPSSDFVRQTVSEMAVSGEFKAVTIHMYGRSVNGAPKDGWIWGSVEQGLEDMRPFLGDMQVDLTEVGCWSKDGNLGQAAQQRFVQEVCAFQHDLARSIYLFCLNDTMVPPHELEAGKDWGLQDSALKDKLAATAFKGTLSIQKPQPAIPEFIMGFRDFVAILRDGGIPVADPVHNEFGPWPRQQVQRTKDGGLFVWCDIAEVGGRLSYFHSDGRMFRWDAGWPSFEQMVEGRAR